MSYRDWHVGMRVVCIDDLSLHPRLKEWPCTVPSAGIVYTIREIFPEDRFVHSRPGDLWVRLREVVNAPHQTRIGPYEPAFNVRHFRPIDESRLDIFRAHLAPSPKQKVRA